jgi:hypothetical protein
MALMPADRVCPKCGATLTRAQPKAFPEPTLPALPVNRPSHLRLVLALVALLLLGGSGALVWMKTSQTEAMAWFPLAAGRVWEMQDAQDPTWRLQGTLAPPQDVGGQAAWSLHVAHMGADGTPTEVGVGYLVPHLRGMNLLGVDYLGQHLFDLRLASFPMTTGRSWQWEWRENYQLAAWRGKLAVVSDEESQTVPAGTFQTVHVHGDIGQKLMDAQVGIDLWVARGEGLVRFKLSVPGGIYGLDNRDLVLRSFR